MRPLDDYYFKGDLKGAAPTPTGVLQQNPIALKGCCYNNPGVLIAV